MIQADMQCETLNTKYKIERKAQCEVSIIGVGVRRTFHDPLESQIN